VRSLDVHFDLCDVRDVVRAYASIADSGQSGGVYNIGTGVATSGTAIFATLCEAAGQDRQAIETHPGERLHPRADASRLRAATGWQPTIPLQQTVADTLAFWRSRPAW
jgi:GDP-4-dehydro-6-deoxy-D-mannose reductase